MAGVAVLDEITNAVEFFLKEGELAATRFEYAFGSLDAGFLAFDDSFSRPFRLDVPAGGIAGAASGC